MASDIPDGVRNIVYDRDSYRCRWCGRMDVGVHIHHILYRSEGGKHVLENLITLCHVHHAEAHSDKGKYQQLLLDVVAMDPPALVSQVIRWRESDQSPTGLSTGGDSVNRTRRMLDLD